MSHSTATLFLLGLILFVFRHERKLACRFAGAFSLGTLVLVGPWLVRNKLVVDHFTLTSETGFALARAHNEYTFQYSLPCQYRRKLGPGCHENMSEDKRQERDRVADDEFAAEAWYRRQAFDYIREHPWETMGHGFYKVAVNFLGILSPLQGTVKNTVYTISYWILTLLAPRGPALRSRHVVFEGVCRVTARSVTVSFVFSAHTSHRSWLDPLFAVPAGIGLAAILRSAGGRSISSSATGEKMSEVATAVHRGLLHGFASPRSLSISAARSRGFRASGIRPGVNAG